MPRSHAPAWECRLWLCLNLDPTTLSASRPPPAPAERRRICRIEFCDTLIYDLTKHFLIAMQPIAYWLSHLTRSSKHQDN